AARCASRPTGCGSSWTATASPGRTARRSPRCWVAAARAMYDLLCAGAREGRQPWARIHAEDGAYWRATAAYLDAHVGRWTSALE
ncbi:hypothetical protein, partial [Micromonospora globispora]|uniref:hypothetical protein n=1 Tax=Micromonospora globispora TaxID=1450148 RepID=UPI001A9C486F